MSETRQTGWKSLMSWELPDSPADRLAKGLADALDGDAVENLLKEAGHDHANRLLAGQAARQA